MESISHFYSTVLRIAFELAPLRILIIAGLLIEMPSVVISENWSVGEKAMLGNHPIAEDRMSIYPNDFPDRTSVWLVSNPETGARAFLAGTVHALKDVDLPLPSPYYAAYHLSDVVVTESGLGNAGAGAVDGRQLMTWTQKNRSHLTIGGARSVERLLQPETVYALKAFLGRDYAGLRKKAPFILLMKVAQRKPDQLPGIEDVFVLQAKRDGKRILRLDGDSVHQTALKVMDELLQSHLTQVEERGLDALFLDAMKDSPGPVFNSCYRKGDVVEMNAIYEARKRAGGLFEETLPRRNRQWMEKIVGMLGENSPQVEYVLVGGGHLAGDEGLLQLLENKGFKLEQLFGVDRPAAGTD